MIWALLMGCGLGLWSTTGETGLEPDPVSDQVAWSISPTSITMGETPVDVAASGWLTLTNTGDTELLVLDLGSSVEEHLELLLSDAPMLAPGASTQLEVVWTPEVPGLMDSSLSMSVGGSPSDPQEVTIPVDGTAMGAVPTLSTTSYDFGDVGISCEDELTVTITNTGNVAMQIDDVMIHGAEGYRMDEPDDLPWSLNPFQSHEQVVYFSPDELGEVFGELAFETDQGTIGTALQAEGVVDEERTMTFDVGEQGRSTIIFNVNLTAIPNSTEDQYSQFFVAALPTFFETLLDNHASYRAGFVWSVAGQIDGDYDYIDETFTATEATEIALEMIAPGANGGDNDANFRTILAAVSVNQDWLSEDDSWADSRLSIITIQRDTEASGGSWSNWLSEVQAYKDDKEDVVYHAIAGPVPGGCGSAEAFMDYDKAVTETGGLFLSVCEPDWTNHMSKLATACVEGAQGIFPLEGSPMESSIEVSVDGVPMTEGWMFDESLNAVTFEQNVYPDFESTVTIYYWMSGGCG